MSRSSSSNSRKRGRDQEVVVDQNDREAFSAPAAPENRDAGLEAAGGVLRPVGIFEFPWHVVEFDSSSSIWNPHRVFFTSLVDGCSASIGIPGDRLFAVGRSLLGLFDDEATPSDDETDDGDVDCDCDVWSYVLRHPLRWPS